MAWMKCDSCKSSEYTPDNPFVEIRQPRPSDHSDMCCTLAGHLKCFSKSTTVDQLPQIGETGGTATHDQWETWIESPEAAKMGFCFIT